MAHSGSILAGITHAVSGYSTLRPQAGRQGPGTRDLVSAGSSLGPTCSG